MSQIEITDSQRRALTTLLNKYQQSESPVTAERIAAAVDRNTGSVRNMMQGLKLLNLVEGIPGQQGGYKPTDSAFQLLGRDDLDEEETVTLAQDFQRINVTVDSITFPNLFHPSKCSVRIHFQQRVDIAVGDPVAVGPTPLSDLVVSGQVEAINDTRDEVLLDVATLEAPVVNE